MNKAVIIPVVLVIAVVIWFFSVFTYDLFATKVSVIGKISDVKYVPQNYASSWFTDVTEVTFYSGSTYSFAGNHQDKLIVGENYKITYNRSLIGIIIYKTITKIEKLPL